MFVRLVWFIRLVRLSCVRSVRLGKVRLVS